MSILRTLFLPQPLPVHLHTFLVPQLRCTQCVMKDSHYNVGHVSKVANRKLKHGPPENKTVRHNPLRLFVADGSRGNARNLQLQHQDKVHIDQALTTCGCTCVEVFNEFCDRSTLHGLKYIGDKNLHFLER
jgi:hypothetical protein